MEKAMERFVFCETVAKGCGAKANAVNTTYACSAEG
jgi:hypothetical protein